MQRLADVKFSRRLIICDVCIFDDRTTVENVMCN